MPHGGLAEWSARCGGADGQSDNTWSPIAIFGPQAPRGRPYQEVEVGSIFRNADTAELVMISASSPLPFFCVRPACLAAAAGGESKGCVWVRRGADGMICCEKQKGKSCVTGLLFFGKNASCQRPQAPSPRHTVPVLIYIVYPVFCCCCRSVPFLAGRGPAVAAGASGFRETYFLLVPSRRRDALRGRDDPRGAGQARARRRGAGHADASRVAQVGRAPQVTRGVRQLRSVPD